MLNINKTKLKKYRIPLLLCVISLGGIFLYQYLTFIPEYSSAAPISTDTPVTITATTPLAKWDDLEYMQQMTSQACESVATPATAVTNVPSKQLIDARDGKIYWVSKLKDGQCWMTQNLDYDDPGSVKVTSTSGNNGGPSDRKQSPTDYWDDIIYRRQYWDPGDNKTAKEGSSILVTLTVTKDEDRHYLIGNYYSWLSAMAGATTEGAQGVCPDGWQLPTSDPNNTDNRSFSKLMIGISAGSTLVDTKGPYYFLYGGSAFAGILYRADREGYYWSSTPWESSGARHLDFISTGVSASAGSGRQGGYSVRCVAKDTSNITPVDPSAGGSTGINDPNVSVIVPNIITLDVSDSVDIATESKVVNTGNFTATVESNKDYTISLNAVNDNADATSLVNYKDGNKVGEIPTIAENAQPTVGISSWGIRTCTGLTMETCTTDYQPLPTKNTTNTFTTGTKGTHQHLFQIGIGIGPKLPSGTYTTSIQVTAAQK